VAVEHAAGAVLLLEPGESEFVRVVEIFRVLLGVQVVEVAEELIETVRRRQVLVAIAEVIFPDLSRRLAVVLQQLGDRRVLGLQSDGGPG
jgi:hypothetical protein